MSVCTRVVTAGNSFVISANMGVINLTYQMSNASGDNGTITGNFTAVDSTNTPIASEAITIPAGGGNTLSSTTNRPIDGVTLHCVQGTLNIILGF